MLLVPFRCNCSKNGRRRVDTVVMRAVVVGVAVGRWRRSAATEGIQWRSPAGTGRAHWMFAVYEDVKGKTENEIK